MFNQRTRSRDHALRLAFVAAGLIVCNSASNGQNTLLEPESAAAAARPAPVERDALTQELHRAREAGDQEALAALQALMPRPSTAGGEGAGGTILLATTTVGGAGCALPAPKGGSSKIADPDEACGGDEHVRVGPTPLAEFHHSMASDSNGNLYVAWQDNNFSPDPDYIQVYQSSNGGESWQPFGYVLSTTDDLTSPSIAVGEGSNGDTVLVAYLRDGAGIVVPEVATAPIATGVFTPHSIPVWGFWEGYDKPVIVTDSYDFGIWYAYLVCEGIYEAAVDNINTCSWRSTDGGATWGNELIPFGDFDVYPWVDPDVSFGTTQDRVFIVNYHDDDHDIYMAASDNFAVSYNTPANIGSLALLPVSHDVDPEIAAATDLDNVMIAFTRSDGVAISLENIAYTYSQDAGATWSNMWTLPTCVGHYEYAVSLTANEGGGSWHIAYTSSQDGSVRYNSRPQDLSDLWSWDAMIMDDMAAAGTYDDYSKKGIASNWTTDMPCVVWADRRDNTPGDYDTWADFLGNTGLMLDNRLVSAIDAATVHFTLNAGPGNAGRIYVLAGTRSGTSPGIPLPGPGGPHWLPINFDDVTEITVTNGAPRFIDFIGLLDGNGMGEATLNLPPNCGLSPGDIMHFAFATYGPWDHVSNAVEVPVSIF